MSLRNIRKVFGGTQLPPPDEGSEDEYEPSYTRNHTKCIYAGLEISSESEGNEEDTDEVSEEPKPECSKKKTQKRRRKQRKQKDSIPEDPIDNELDEIDKCLKEINATFGEPEKPVEILPEKDPMKIKKHLFTVRQQYLEADNEFKRMFGPPEDEDGKKRGRQPNFRIIAQKGSIIGTDKIFRKRGLSMELLERKNNAIYFAFEHSKEYQRIHRTYLYAHDDTPPHEMFPLEESQRRMHVEGLLELADRLYFAEEFTSGTKVVEDIISYMQQCAHPFFSVTDMRARVEYKHIQNRAFHIALLKYMHTLSNKACHRTALELAKLLLNLDPSDPLAVLFVIDSIAIRAREYQWIIEAIEFWNEERDAGFLFNMQYTYALATYHIAKKKKEAKARKEKPRLKTIVKSAFSLLSKCYKQRSKASKRRGGRKLRMRPGEEKAGFEKADELIQNAILKFPTVVSYMLQIAGIKNPKIQSCPLFDVKRDDGCSSNLKDLMRLYARLIWNKFIEEPVLKWLTRNATVIAEKYDLDPMFRGQAKAHANVRMNLFQTYPQEILRHLSIITPLNNLLFDGDVPAIDKVVSYDPSPPLDSVNIYERKQTTGNIFYEVFSELMPDNELEDVGMEYV